MLLYVDSAPSVIFTESLVQVTVVAGPPVELQVRVKRGRDPQQSSSTVNSIPVVVTSPINNNDETF